MCLDISFSRNILNDRAELYKTDMYSAYITEKTDVLPLHFLLTVRHLFDCAFYTHFFVML